MGTRQVTMPEFLRLLTAGLLKVNSGSSGTIAIKSALPPVKPSADLKNGNIYKSEYIVMAGKIISFIDIKWKSTQLFHKHSRENSVRIISVHVFKNNELLQH